MVLSTLGSPAIYDFGPRARFVATTYGEGNAGGTILGATRAGPRHHTDPRRRRGVSAGRPRDGLYAGETPGGVLPFNRRRAITTPTPRITPSGTSNPSDAMNQATTPTIRSHA